MLQTYYNYLLLKYYNKRIFCCQSYSRFNLHFLQKHGIIKEKYHNYLKGGHTFMDIAGVGFALNTVSSYNIGSSTGAVTLPEMVSVAMLDKTMELNQSLNTQMVQALEHSVTPHLGGNIDLYV